MRRDDGFGSRGGGRRGPFDEDGGFFDEEPEADPLPDDQYVDDEYQDELSSPGPRDERGGSSRSGGAARFDWGAAEADASVPEERVEWEEYGHGDDAPMERVSQRRKRRRRPVRASLLELATPVLGYCSVLPRETGDPQPAFEPFRREVVASLNALESAAPQHGIEQEDAKLASYALCLLLDEQVAESAWDQKSQWMGGPLTLALHQDPEGGVNFFKRLEALRENQAGVKAVFLVCLALGFRGKYVGLDPAQAAAELGGLRQSLLRQIHPVSMDKVRRLFPDAYKPSKPLEDDVAPPPRWWLYASGGAVLFALLLYLGLWLWAGATGSDAAKGLTRLPEASTAALSDESPAPVPPPTEVEELEPEGDFGAAEDAP